jgi:hypothetical protein
MYFPAVVPPLERSSMCPVAAGVILKQTSR